MSLNRKERRTAGFTLIELMIVLFILGLLAGYYTVYAVGLIRWKFRSQSAGSPGKTGQPDA